MKADLDFAEPESLNYFTSARYLYAPLTYHSVEREIKKIRVEQVGVDVFKVTVTAAIYHVYENRCMRLDESKKRYLGEHLSQNFTTKVMREVRNYHFPMYPLSSPYRDILYSGYSV
jgi:hypothetical protein